MARFDSPLMSSDGGLLVLREVELRLGIAARLAGCISDRPAPGRVQHGLDEIIRTRMLMIAGGYEDGNDADTLRADPMFKRALGRLPEDADLCAQPTISRFENLPDAPALLRMSRAMIFLHIGAYWLMWSLRSRMPCRSFWRVAQFDTWRLRLIKLAERVEVLKKQVCLHLPDATPNQAIFALMLSRLSRLTV